MTATPQPSPGRPPGGGLPALDPALVPRAGRLWSWAGINRSSAGQTLQFLLLLALLVWLTIRGADAMGYNWQWYRIPKYLLRISDGRIIWGPLLRGAAQTLGISAWSLLLTVSLGLLTAILRLSDLVTGRILARCYLELIRNTPLLVQLNLFYFVVSPIFGIDRYWTGVLCLAVFEAAFASEIFRAGILSVPKGQWEASRSLGLSPAATYRLVVLPQALAIMLPPLAGLAITLVKHSAIVSVIALYELTTAGRDIISTTFMSFEVWFTVAAIYLAITLLLSLLAGWLERRLQSRR